jgi:hypothetical protein
LIVLQIYWRYRPPALLKSSIDFVIQLKGKCNGGLPNWLRTGGDGTPVDQFQKKFGKPIGCAYICNRMAAETKSICVNGQTVIVRLFLYCQ